MDFSVGGEGGEMTLYSRYKHKRREIVAMIGDEQYNVRLRGGGYLVLLVLRRVGGGRGGGMGMLRVGRRRERVQITRKESDLSLQVEEGGKGGNLGSLRIGWKGG